MYWNYKNYIFSKQQLIKDVQMSLDKSVDDYYLELAKKTTLGFKIEEGGETKFFKKEGFFHEISKSIDISNNKFKKLDSLDVSSIKGITVFRGFEADLERKNIGVDYFLDYNNNTQLEKTKEVH